MEKIRQCGTRDGSVEREEKLAYDLTSEAAKRNKSLAVSLIAAAMKDRHPNWCWHDIAHVLFAQERAHVEECVQRAGRNIINICYGWLEDGSVTVNDEQLAELLNSFLEDINVSLNAGIAEAVVAIGLPHHILVPPQAVSEVAHLHDGESIEDAIVRLEEEYSARAAAVAEDVANVFKKKG